MFRYGLFLVQLLTVDRLEEDIRHINFKKIPVPIFVQYISINEVVTQLTLLFCIYNGTLDFTTKIRRKLSKKR